jgi:hypothetical protein
MGNSSNAQKYDHQSSDEPDNYEFEPDRYLRKKDKSYEIEICPDGTTYEYRRKNGKCHREDGPAITVYRPDGSKSQEFWYKNGKIYRADGPTATAYRPDGSKAEELWIENGNFRKDGPAKIEYGSDGSKSAEYWNKNGKMRKVQQVLFSESAKH